MANTDNIPYTTLDNLYGDENVVLDEFFPESSFINFGFHPDLFDPNKTVSIEERVQSEEALYDYIFKKLELAADDLILEVGCGRGDGCIRLAHQFPIAEIKGLDLIPKQIARALKRHQNALQLYPFASFHVGSAEHLPFPDASFSKIYSIEAAQHFISLDAFAKECKRTLQANGKVVLTTFFAKDQYSLDILKTMMPINVGSVDVVKTIQEALQSFEQNGFSCVEQEMIGSSVFPFFDTWLRTQKTQDWARLWAKAWRDGLLEYYVLVFE